MGTSTFENWVDGATGQDRRFATVDELERGLAAEKYVADRGLATTIFLTLKLQKPLLLEGEAGVGKTEIAKVLSSLLAAPLIRLQCYEGLDAASAIYEWDYPRQMLYLRTLEATAAGSPADREATRRDLFGEEFLLKRPLLQAIDAAHDRAPVLLIDEVDRADQELEAFLLELLSDFQVTVPELGTIRAEHPPVVILTSNRTREIHDALKRRCLYHWIDFPTFDKEFRILATKVPEASQALARQIVAFTQGLRDVDLFKPPGMAETLDWARALLALGTAHLSDAVVDDSLGVILKYQEDVDQIRGKVAADLVARAARVTPDPHPQPPRGPTPPLRDAADEARTAPPGPLSRAVVSGEGAGGESRRRDPGNDRDPVSEVLPSPARERGRG